MTKEKEKKLSKGQQLLEAARLGQVQQLDSILGQFNQLKLRKKINPLASLRKSFGPNNIRDPVTGFTCLHHASLNNHAQCVRLILDHGAKLNSVDYKGSSALHLAAWAGNLEIVKILLNYDRLFDGQEFVQQQSPTSFIHQQQINSSNQQADFRESIIIDLCNNDNQTPLSLAAQFGHNAVVEELLNHGASVYLRNSQLESPLDLACLYGRLETVKLILNNSPPLIVDLRAVKSSLIINREPINGGEEAAPEISSFREQPKPRLAATSGWSSILRTGGAGSRRESSTSHSRSMDQATGTGNSNNDSSFVAGFKQTKELRKHEKSFRRATLSISAPLPANFDLSAYKGSPICDSLCESQASCEKLLDHSPLHYAIRKGHLNVAQLLLFQYKANLFQLTTLGSVLHEIALSNLTRQNGNDLLKLIFSYLKSNFHNHLNSQHNHQLISFTDYLNEFLNLKNVHQKTVFEVLNDINNRSAHAIKRLIYEYSEQQLAKPDNSGRNLQLTSPEQRKFQQQQVQGPIDFKAPSSQLISKQFSDMQQINSFLTMKRVPKLDAKAQKFNSQQQQALMLKNRQMPMDTQTIGRKSSLSSRPIVSSNQLWQFSHDSADPKRPEAEPTLTRSSSNLAPNLSNNQVPWQQYMTNSQNLAASVQLGPNLHETFERVPLANSSFQDKNNNQQQVGGKLRSKSRDFGFMSVEALRRECLKENNFPYENNAQRFSPSDWRLRAHENQSLAQLVRSQTDCSHLMERFFPTSANQEPMAGEEVDKIGSALKTKTLDRKTINRHYHVYEHEFYPPRILASNGQLTGPRQFPVGTAQLRAQNNCNNFRASTRSATGVQLNQAGGSRFDSGANKSIDFGANISQQAFMANNSRLSLNIEPQTDSSRQQKIDRFVGKHNQYNLNPNRCSSVDQRRRDLVELQRRLLLEVSGNQAAQFPNSLSLESHLSEPHLFDETRRALMKDFDRMIGEELLNKKQDQSRGASFLTGVMLDMDKYGDRLTVSGIPAREHQSELAAPRAGDSDDHPGSGRAREPQNFSPESQVSAPRAAAPTKPPRPSLAKQQSEAGGCKQAIYDQPSQTATVCKDHKLDRPNASGGEIKPIRRGNERVQKLASQFNSSAPSAQSSLTEPPRVKPPPPPKVANLNSPRQAQASRRVHGATSGNQQWADSSPGDLVSTAQNESGPVGLLKVSSSAPSSNNSSTRSIAKLSSILMDTDSGVCTSNSPASTETHEFEANEISMVHKNSLGVEIMDPTGVIDRHLSPPSPNTAQLCVEEAFMPLTKNEQPSKKATSNQTCSPIEFGCPLTARPSNESSVDNWLSSHSAGAGKRLVEYENCRELQLEVSKLAGRDFDAAKVAATGATSDDDYAPSEASESEAVQQRNRDESSQINSDRRKEFLLKVLVDGASADESSNDEDAFYIDPSELKRLATKRSQIDAETSTDEELCAAIDRQSGFIKFTLKKRRNNKSLEEVTKNSPDAAQNDESFSRPPMPEVYSPVKDVRRRSEMSETQANRSSQGKSSPRCEDGVNFERNTELENQFHRWFSTNLIGLIEYAPKFTCHGFDNLNFLNDPRIINEETLREIGICDESHRLIIIENITSKLPKVDFKKLLENVSSVLDLFNSLELAISVNELNHPLTLQSPPEELREKFGQKLSLGQRNRLFAALEHFASIKGHQQSRPLSKQISNESTEVELSQADSSTSSSTSKESIKSIVQMRTKRIELASKQTEPKECEASNRLDKMAEVKIQNQPEIVEQDKQLKRTRSLVSETAKLFDSVNSRPSEEKLPAPPPRPPVAAVRRFMGQSAPHQQSEPIRRENIPAPTRSGLKTVCWPPKKNQRNSLEAQVDCKPPLPPPPSEVTKHKFAAKRMSLKSIDNSEESESERERKEVPDAVEAPGSGLRPAVKMKPQPPAKPAKLVKGDFNLCISGARNSFVEGNNLPTKERI